VGKPLPTERLLTSVVHSRHLGRLTPDQGATGLETPLGDPSDDVGSDGHVELGARKVVQEVQRLGSLNDEIINRHGDEVDTYKKCFRA
jgi:hypothetical protein